MSASLSHALVPRGAERAIREALADTRVVVVHGPRQAGKSTLAGGVAASLGGTTLTLDDDTVLASARQDPAAFVQRHGLLMIDEIQRAPELFLAIKAKVDRDQTPGQFLLTGSAQILAVPHLGDSLTGRMEIVELWPFSQRELERHPGSFIDIAVAGRTLDMAPSELTKLDYLERAVTGGFPEAVRRVNAGRRDRWFDAYLTTMIQRDVAGLADIERSADLPRVLRLLAARTATVLNVDAVARDAAVPPTTMRRYLSLLEATFAIQRIPAWTTSRTTRAAHAPKLHVTDTGVAAHLLGANPLRLARPGQDAGPLLETFVVMELRRQLGWSDERVRLHHYRNRDGVEVDAVLEAADGRVVGIEVKAGSTVRADDFRGLRQLRSMADKSFVIGIVLYTGREPLPFGDQLVALPISSLWS